jgi:hypothetical protein
MTDEAASQLPNNYGSFQPGTPLTYGPVGQNGLPDPDAFHRPTNECFWLEADYIMSWFRAPRSAGPLVTTGSIQDPHPGALDQPSTAVLFGNKPLDFGMFSGIRAGAGVFLDKCDHFSIDGSGFIMFSNDVIFALQSDSLGNPLIARPVVNAVNGAQSAYLDSLPGLIAGGIVINATSELMGAELNATYHDYPGKCCMWDCLLGFRYLRLAESLTFDDRFAPLVSNVLTFQGAPISPPDTLADMDRFRTSNDFYGMQIGGRVRWECDWFNFGLFGKAALGATEQQVNIAGTTTLFTPTSTTVANGGVLALPTNSGEHDRTYLGFVSELGATFGVNLCCHVELTATYSFLYWNRVVRPNGQIDRTVNVSLVPSDAAFGLTSGPPRPAFNFNEELFWAQSLSFGLTFRY